MKKLSSNPSAKATKDRKKPSLETALGTLSIITESNPIRQVQYKPEKTTLRRGSGEAIPTRFDQTAYGRNPSSMPLGCLNTYAVLEGGRAGWAVEFGGDHMISGRLENTGPFGDANMLDGITPSALRLRAHLRAVIAALRCPFLLRAGQRSIVIVTMEPEILKRATVLLPNWLSKGWLGPTRDDGQPAATDSTLTSTDDSTLPSTKDSKPRGTSKKTLPEPQKPPLPGASNKDPPPTILDHDLWELFLGECDRFKEQGFPIEI